MPPAYENPPGRAGYAAIGAALLLGILSGIRWPQTYALSHVLIDYGPGFGKRGFLGLLLHLLRDPPYHYLTLAKGCFLVLAAWLAMLLGLARRVMPNRGITLAFAAFFVSIPFASLVRDAGRGEHFGLLLGLPCLAMPVSPLWVLVRVAVLAAAIMIHEGNFLLIVPVVTFDALLAARDVFRGARAASTAVLLIPTCALTLYLGAAKRACDVAAVTAMYQRQAADFQFLPVPVTTLCLDGADNVRGALHNLVAGDGQMTLLVLTLVVLLPLLAANLAMLVRTVHSAWLAAAGIGAALGPLAFAFIATDIVRLVSLAGITSLLALLSAVRRCGLPASGLWPRSSVGAVAAAALLVLSAGSTLPLNDGNDVARFPYLPLVRHVVQAVQGRVPFLQIPTY